MIASIVNRLRLAFRQFCDGWRGKDWNLEMVRETNRGMMVQAELNSWRARSHSRRIVVRTIELVDLGDSGDRWAGEPIVRRRIRSRGFTAPMGFLEPITGKDSELMVDVSVSEALCHSMKDGGVVAIQHAVERAAARMGIALVCGPEATRC